MTFPLELFLHTFAIPGQVAGTARWAEEAGFTGLLVADSQSLTADVWVELATASAQTRRLLLGPGSTNPRTRHPTVTASAAATLQAESGGRAVLGLARGDSALTHAGLEPPAVAEFEQDLVGMQALLAGGATAGGLTLRWVAGSQQPKVPLHVAATGPRVIAAAARHADGVDLTVGAEGERLAGAVQRIREAAGDRRPSIGAYVNVAVDADAARARDLVRGSAATLARFGSHARAIAGAYDPDRHGAASSPLARSLDDEMLDRFAVAGPAPYVAERLASMVATGLDRLILVPGSLDSDPGDLARSNELLVDEVLPALGPVRIGEAPSPGRT